MSRARSGLVVLGVMLACDPEPRLEGRGFYSESVEGHTFVGGTEIFLGFYEDGRVGFTAGCDVFNSASYELDDGIFELDSLWVNEGECDDALLEQDEWLRNFFESAPEWSFEEPRLTLSSGSTTVVFRDEASGRPDKPLVGPVWAVHGLLIGSLARYGIVEGDPTLLFGEDGQLSIATPCATGSGNYVVHGSSLELSGVVIEPPIPDCPDAADEYDLRYHDQMVEVLADGTAGYQIHEARMWITRGDVGLDVYAD